MSQKEATPDDGRWYPGKHAKRALVNFKQRRELVEAKKAKGEWQPPTNPLAPFNIMLKEKRPLGVRAAGGAAPAVGQLFVSVLGGTFRTKRAYLILELDGNEQRTETATCDAPSWNDDFAFPVHDPSSDLRIFVFDDEKAANERPVGRVIIPLARLCRGLLLRTPSAPRRLLLQVSPVCTQHAKATAVTEPSAKLSVFLLRSSAAAAFPSPPCSFASNPATILSFLSPVGMSDSPTSSSQKTMPAVRSSRRAWSSAPLVAARPTTTHGTVHSGSAKQTAARTSGSAKTAGARSRCGAPK